MFSISKKNNSYYERKKLIRAFLLLFGIIFSSFSIMTNYTALGGVLSIFKTSPVAAALLVPAAVLLLEIVKTAALHSFLLGLFRYKEFDPVAFAVALAFWAGGVAITLNAAPVFLVAPAAEAEAARAEREVYLRTGTGLDSIPPPPPKSTDKKTERAYAAAVEARAKAAAAVAEAAAGREAAAAAAGAAAAAAETAAGSVAVGMLIGCDALLLLCLLGIAIIDSKKGAAAPLPYEEEPEDYEEEPEDYEEPDEYDEDPEPEPEPEPMPIRRTPSPNELLLEVARLKQQFITARAEAAKGDEGAAARMEEKAQNLRALGIDPGQIKTYKRRQ